VYVSYPEGPLCTVLVMTGPPPPKTLFPYTTLFRSTCDVKITSSTPGENEIQAETKVVVGGVELTRTTGDKHPGDSENAHKTFVDANIQITHQKTTHPNSRH